MNLNYFMYITFCLVFNNWFIDQKHIGLIAWFGRFHIMEHNLEVQIMRESFNFSEYEFCGLIQLEGIKRFL